ncbi:hypothetical protein L873DRAFT_1691273 [Choiromyces venosus 120613-1]|uniref:D-isomer specific 2-hydroxyacid dehydrogenase NAD-binding domain-containing protein n=1 Tax=Choiromyces venosus 120613-1 TaxID=1336337 RepID=A0A3N4JLN2_9PEZI|nr:hypothetical protein L873DRAFT_1691273 [Choiromyces venosus 120613-1]
MPRPTALLLGKIDHARREWESLSAVAGLKEIASGTRESIIQDFKDGKYDGVVAIYRTYDSAKITGRFDKDFVSQLPSSVKFLCHNGAGYDQIDVEPCTARGILVSHTPGAVNDATANVAMMLILQALRKTYIAETSLRAGTWRGKLPLGHDPDGKTLGILGLGGIGVALSIRAKAFGMRLIYHNRREAVYNPGGAEYEPNLNKFLARCDVLSIHLPLGDGTRHFLGKKELRTLKRGAVLVNTARGAVVDEAALVEVLEEGHLGGVGLDVYEDEPKIHEGLIGREDAVLFPHIGTFTVETQVCRPLLLTPSTMTG